VHVAAAKFLIVCPYQLFQWQSKVVSLLVPTFLQFEIDVFCRKCLKIPNEQAEAVNRTMTDTVNSEIIAMFLLLQKMRLM
jgi:hypothetical protein